MRSRSGEAGRGVQGHGGAGGPAVQDDVPGTVAHGEADRGVQVAPFGGAEVAEAVGGTRGSGVSPVGDVQHGELLSAQEAHQVHGVVPGGAEAVRGDDPGVAVTGHPPGGQPAELAGDLDLAVLQAEGAARVPPVELGSEADLGARFQGAVGDPLQAAHDGVGGGLGPFHDGADHGMDAGALDPVRAGAERGEGAGQGDPADRRGVHGESAVGGEGTSGRRLEGGVAGVPVGPRPLPHRRRGGW